MPEPNVFDPSFEPDDEEGGFFQRRARLGRQAGAERLGASLYELPPGKAAWPYHLQYANEEMLIVLAGAPTLRTNDGERELPPGEVVSFPTGRAGAHRVDNHSDEPARVLIVSTMKAPEVAEYPDSGKVLARSTLSPKDDAWLRKIFRAESAVDYYDGEV